MPIESQVNLLSSVSLPGDFFIVCFYWCVFFNLFVLVILTIPMHAVMSLRQISCNIHVAKQKAVFINLTGPRKISRGNRILLLASEFLFIYFDRTFRFCRHV